jgi:hypothetical protein
MVGEDFLVQRRPGLLETEVDGELVGLHVDNGTCYGFNGTATRVWSMIEAPMRVSALRDALMAEFEVDPETCAAQLMELLRDLEADGLVELRPAQQPS